MYCYVDMYYYVDIVGFRASTRQDFVLPQSIQQWEKRTLLIKRRLLLINTSLCATLDDVGFQGLQDSSFWVSTIHPLTGTHVLACKPTLLTRA